MELLKNHNYLVKITKLKSYCKINLSLKVIKRLSNGYHNITSLITFTEIHDVILIFKSKSLKDHISFSGKFKKGINKKTNTVTKVLDLLRKKKLIEKKFFNINIIKNIPHGSGLGGGSSNAASILNFFNKKMNLNKIKLQSLAKEIGFDTPINLEKKNTFLTGKKDKFIRINEKLNLILLIVYPNLICSTKTIYRKNKKISPTKIRPFINIKNKKHLYIFLKNENNDLENTVTKIYPKVGEVIDYIKLQKGCYFSRITGSGSACIGIFSNKVSAIYAQKAIRLKYPKYWSVVSKTI